MRLYGEVQAEVISARLAEEFGIAVDFAPVEPLGIRKPHGIGQAEHHIAERAHNEYWATIGLRVEPGTGLRYRIGVREGLLPRAFYAAIEETVRELAERWRITDCLVTLTAAGYASPVSTAGDFRVIARKMFAEALDQAGVAEYEPVHEFELEVPESKLSAALGLLTESRARVEHTSVRPDTAVLTGFLPSGQLGALPLSQPGGYWPRRSRPEQRGRLPCAPAGEREPGESPDWCWHTGDRGERVRIVLVAFVREQARDQYVHQRALDTGGDQQPGEEIRGRGQWPSIGEQHQHGEQGAESDHGGDGEQSARDQQYQYAQGELSGEHPGGPAFGEQARRAESEQWRETVAGQRGQRTCQRAFTDMPGVPGLAAGQRDVPDTAAGEYGERGVAELVREGADDVDQIQPARPGPRHDQRDHRGGRDRARARRWSDRGDPVSHICHASCLPG